jgi:hypothetical protein
LLLAVLDAWYNAHSSRSIHCSAAGGDPLLKAYFYDSNDDEVPLGEEERWIEAVPRCGDTVTLVFAASGEPAKRGPFMGEVVSVQWTFEPSDTPEDPDYCTVDITLRALQVEASTAAGE